MSFSRYAEYRDSGVEWLGKVPTHWEVLPLARISADKCDGPFGSGLKSEHYADEGVRVIRLQNIRSGNFDGSDAAFVGEDYYQELAGHDVQAGDVLIAGLGDERNTVGRACVAPDDLVQAMVKADCFRFRLLRERALPAFVAAELTAGAAADAGVLASGSTRSRISLTVMASRKIALPPLAEQAAIAAFLDRETGKIDALVAEQEKLIALLKEKRQAAIFHAVAKGLDPAVPMKDSGVEWLGEVPAHWEVVPLKRCWEVIDCKHVTAEFVDDGYPLASIREIQGRYVQLESAKLTTEQFYELMIEGGRKPQPGDLIFSRNATVGEVAQVADWHPPFAMGQDVCLLRKNDPEHSSDHMQALLKSRAVSARLSLLMIGSTFKRVNVEEIRGLIIPMPPPEEQGSIAAYIETEDAKAETLTAEAQRAIDLLKERRAALISAAVTGKIDVRGLVGAPTLRELEPA